MAVGYLEATNEKENQRNLIEELISVKARNDCVEWCIQCPLIMLWNLTRSKARIYEIQLCLVFCHHVLIK